MNTNTKKMINFVGMRKAAMVLSIIMIIASIGSLVVNGLNLGVDFTGGTVIEVGYPEAANVDDIRKALTDGKFDATVQHFGTAKDVLIRIAPQEGVDRAQVGVDVVAILKSGNPAVEMRRVEFVGPQIGDELRDDGGTAMLMALGFILIYVALRFEFRFSIGAIIALLHDVIITVGIFSITRMEFDLTILAAILAIIGYSLNDTIVVFDRVRENFLKLRKI